MRNILVKPAIRTLASLSFPYYLRLIMCSKNVMQFEPIRSVPAGMFLAATPKDIRYRILWSNDDLDIGAVTAIQIWWQRKKEELFCLFVQRRV